VKHWVDTDAANSMESTSKPKLVENGYARVWGKLRIFSNKRHVGAHTIRPVSDYNEISCHLLEATVVHLHYTKGPLDSVVKAAQSDGHQQQQNAYGGMQDTGGDRGLAGLSGPAKRVYNCLKTSPQSNEGLHLQDIAQRLGMDTADVAKAGDDLLSMGMIYTTVDDLTWAILEM
jgi:replication factor A2